MRKQIPQWGRVGKVAPIWGDEVVIVEDEQPYIPPPPVIIEDLPGSGDYARSVIYSGIVRDATGELPIPGATVTLYSKGNRVDAMATNSKGEFSFAVPNQVDAITISSAGYQAMNFPASEFQHVFELERNEVELPPVIVTTHKKSNNLWLLALLGIAVYKMK